MKLNQRQKDIISLVEENQQVTVKFLAKTLFFSEMTIRRDLAKLEHEGYLKRYHGGAVVMSHGEHYPIDQRMYLHEQEKRNMAKRAQEHLRDDQTIFLPGCSTCTYLLPFLRNYKGLHVLTNSVQYLTILSEMGIRCTICGGEYFAVDRLLLGRDSERFFRSTNYDIAFLSCDGIDEDGTVSILHEGIAEQIRIALVNAKKRILIADHSKLSNRCKHNICNTADVDDLIIL